jgi:uncharacterized membrane protein
MTPRRRIPSKKWPWLMRIVIARPRLFLSFLAGLVVIVLLLAFDYSAAGLRPTDRPLGLDTVLLIGWDVGLTLYLAATFYMFAHYNPSHIRREAALQDEGSLIILILVIVTAALSLVAIVVSLGTDSGDVAHTLPDLLLLFVTIVLSWSFIQTIFALHYAHEFYSERHGSGGGLRFPNDDTPDYWDFVYFSFGIGTAAQVADVEVTSRRIRKTVVLHSMVAFIFNVTVLALMVNLASAAIADG